MKTFEAAVVLALALAGGNANAESLSDVHAILRQASDAAVTIQAEARRFIALSKIAVAQTRAKDTAGARATVQQASSLPSADKPDVSSLDALAALIAAQVEIGDRPGAARTLERLVRAAASIEKSESAVSIVAAAQAKVGDPAALKTAGSSPLALARVAATRAEAGDRAGALTIVRQALTASASTPEDARAVDLVYIGSAQVRSGDPQGADKTFAEAVRITSGGPQPAGSPLAFLRQLDSLQQIAAAQARVGASKGAARTLEAALPFARKHPDETLRASHLTAIARALAEAGDRAGALRVLAEARAVADKARGNPAQKSTLLLDIAESYAEAGAIKEAVRTLDDLWTSMWKGASHDVIQQAEAQIAKIRDERARAEAKAVLTELVGKLKVAPGWPTGLPLALGGQSEWLAKLGAIQARAGDQVAAASTFQQAVQATSLPGFGPDRVLLGRVALAQAKAGDWQGAATWTVKLAEPEARAHSLLGVAEGLLQRLGITMCDFPSSVAGC